MDNGRNSAFRNTLNFAVMQIGAISVPIYPTISQEDYRHILNHAEVKMIFIEGKDLRARLEPIMPTITSLKEIFTFNEEHSQYKILDELIELGRQHPHPDELTKIKASIESNELATIIYTSGTTGVQKGVMLSHSNLVNH
ncbi:MAG: AMP-dependent synthetase and ligase [Bacteroidetes bacterium]|nr:AMP-dependent synthetase and ligase [Bacteroidota bacterium]